MKTRIAIWRHPSFTSWHPKNHERTFALPSRKRFRNCSRIRRKVGQLVENLSLAYDCIDQIRIAWTFTRMATTYKDFSVNFEELTAWTRTTSNYPAKLVPWLFLCLLLLKLKPYSPSNWYCTMLLKTSRRKNTRWWFVGEENRNHGVEKASTRWRSLLAATMESDLRYGDTEIRNTGLQ